MITVARQELVTLLSRIALPCGALDCGRALLDFSVTPGKLTIDLLVNYPIMPFSKEAITKAIQSSFCQFSEVSVRFTQKIEPHVADAQAKVVPGIKNLIGVASGKGGVGKSTTAVNLALALVSAGVRVGILDADIYGPNQPHLLGICQKPDMTADKKLLPVVRYGLPSMSMGYLVEAKTPMVWRGPMISSALMQLLHDTAWGALDYLIIDLPPGTGDISLTVAKKMPISAVVMVTTPQDVALLDVRKALEMFHKTDIPVLGIIENMATHVCRACGHEEAIFGSGGAKQLSEAYDRPLLGQLPLDRALRESADQGEPMVVKEPEGALTRMYQRIAMAMAVQLAKQKRSYAHHFPKVVVEKSNEQEVGDGH